MTHFTHLEVRRLDATKTEDIEYQPDHVDKGHRGKLLCGVELELRDLDLGSEEGGCVEEDDCKDELIEKEEQGEVGRAIQDGLVSAWAW